MQIRKGGLWVDYTDPVSEGEGVGSYGMHFEKQNNSGYANEIYCNMYDLYLHTTI